MKLSKLIMKVKFKALHVNPVIFNSIKQSGQMDTNDRCDNW